MWDEKEPWGSEHPWKNAEDDSSADPFWDAEEQDDAPWGESSADAPAWEPHEEADGFEPQEQQAEWDEDDDPDETAEIRFTYSRAPGGGSRKIVIVILIVCLVLGLAALIGWLIWKNANSRQPENTTDAAELIGPGKGLTDAVTETTATEQTEPETSTEPQTSEVIDTAFVDAGAAEYVNLYQSADTNSGAVARVYTGDTVEIYAIEGGWYHVQLGEISGYLEEAHVTFTEPQPETEPTTAPKPATTAAPKPSISASVEAVAPSVGSGTDYYLSVSGSYSYYNYELWEGDRYIGIKTASDSYLYLTAGSDFSYVKVNVTPFNQEGEAGETVTCRADRVSNAPAQQSSSVTPCSKYGLINTHGSVVAGFATSYVVNGGSESLIRRSLGDWHIKAVNYCYSRGVNWYELYDSQDGDYYGWVDANYIDFY